MLSRFWGSPRKAAEQGCGSLGWIYYELLLGFNWTFLAALGVSNTLCESLLATLSENGPWREGGKEGGKGLVRGGTAELRPDDSPASRLLYFGLEP